MATDTRKINVVFSYNADDLEDTTIKANQGAEDATSNYKSYSQITTQAKYYDGITDKKSTINTIATSMITKTALKNAGNQLLEVVDYEINKTFQLTDNYKAQNTYNLAKNALSYGMSMLNDATGIAVGLATGNFIQAGLSAIAMVSDTIGRVISYNQELEQQAIDIRQNMEQVSFGRQLVGYSLTDESIGTNR